LRKSSLQGVSLDNVEFKTFTDEENRMISTNIYKEEVRRDYVWLWEGLKSLGPNGLNFNFIKFNWDYMKHDIIDKFAFTVGCLEM